MICYLQRLRLLMNIWHDIDPKRITPDEFIAVIEIPKGSKQKYELDKKTGLLILDRILYTSTHYPANYGFIPHTLADDGDPLDVLVLCSESLLPLSLVKVYPIGVITMNDNGKNDEKIIYSRGLKTYFVSDILDKDVVCRMGDEEHGFKYILAPDFTCMVDGEMIGTVSPEVIEKMPKAN